MTRQRSKRAFHKGKGVVRSVAVVFREFYKDGGMFMAASISFYSLLSLIPLLYFFINVFVYFIGESPNLQAAVFAYVKTIYPMMGPTLTREIARVMGHTRLGWISIVVFLWMGSLVFSSLEYSVNVMFRTEKKRHFVTAAGLSFVMVMVSGIFLAASFWVAYIPTFVRVHQDVIPWSDLVRVFARSVLIKALSLIMIFLSFTSLYKVLPKISVPLRQAAIGGLAAAMLWEASKYAFAWYVGSVSGLAGIYGSLSAIIMFLLWIFYSSTIFLLVAKMVYLRGRGEIT